MWRASRLTRHQADGCRHRLCPAAFGDKVWKTVDTRVETPMVRGYKREVEVSSGSCNYRWRQPAVASTSGRQTTWGTCLALLISCSFIACSETAQPLIEPALVGHWEASLRRQGDIWVVHPTPVLLELYDDNVASLAGLRGSWSLADTARWVVRIDIPGRYETRSYELRLDVKNDDPEQRLSGNMMYSDLTLKFVQTELGGALGVAGKMFGDRESKAREAAANVHQQKGWRRKLYATLYCFEYGASNGISCS